MKNSILILILTCFLFSFTQAQNVGIGNTAPADKLAVGSASQFRVNNLGNITRINNIPYSFPTAHGTQQYLLNDGNGNLSWAASSRPVVRVFTLGANGVDYIIDNPSDYISGNNLDPVLVLYRGFTYHFNNTSGHPFTISDTESMGTFDVGVNNNGAGIGIISFTVPMDAPDLLHYYCAAHPFTMYGILEIH